MYKGMMLTWTIISSDQAARQWVWKAIEKNGGIEGETKQSLREDLQVSANNSSKRWYMHYVDRQFGRAKRVPN